MKMATPLCLLTRNKRRGCANSAFDPTACDKIQEAVKACSFRQVETSLGLAAHPAIQLLFNDCPGGRKSFPRSGDEFFLAANWMLEERQHVRQKRHFVFSALQ